MYSLRISYLNYVLISCLVYLVTPFYKSSQYESIGQYDAVSPEIAKSYHLEDYQWALHALLPKDDIIAFWDKGSQIVLKLSKDDQPPRDLEGDVECSSILTLEPTSGPVSTNHCVYLTRCFAARNNTMDFQYRVTYCFIQNKYAGVCCPKSDIDKIS